MHGRDEYLDDLGKPRLLRSVTAFLDILGFSHSIDVTTGSSAQLMLDRITAAIRGSIEFVQNSFQDEERTHLDRISAKFFSDNLVLGYPCHDDDLTTAVMMVIRCVQRYQLSMALSGFFVRGGLTVGPICLTDEIVFGEALIDSYKLESRASIVPRVIISPALHQPLSSHARLENLNKAWICRDIDGWWFVNYLDSAVETEGVNWSNVAKHRKSIVDSLGSLDRHDVLPKFGWLSRYHNVFCHWYRSDPGYSDVYRIRRADEDSAIHRLDEILDF